MGWREWQIPDQWTYKPVWCPPYPIPVGFWGNLTPFYSKKDVLNTEPPTKKYYFFDTPDFADCHKKIFNYGVFGVKVASVAAIFDVLSNKQLNYWNAFGRAASHFGRIGGSAVMYSAVTCCVANLRGQKQDTYEHPWNHILGGASVGLIWGYKYHSTGMGAAIAFAGALFGIINLRANTSTENYPNGWQILFSKDIDNHRVENGTLGGKNYRDSIRFHWKLSDPGRKGLE